MNEHIDISQLSGLLNNLHRITGLKFALMDYRANEVYTSNFMTRFCACIQDTDLGYQRCRECDAMKLRELHPSGGLKQYRCHAGLIEAAIPVTENGRIVAAVWFGQVLSDEDAEAQWERTMGLCGWYSDTQQLRSAFFELRRMSPQDIGACAEIAQACVSEVRFQGLLQASALTDFQRLALHIEQHYREPLTLDSLSRALGIGKTKLCNLAAREAGTTLTRMVAGKRIAVAKGMLNSTDQSVQQIADQVGIPDSNYFSKVFKRHTGTTPLGYRNQSRQPRGG